MLTLSMQREQAAAAARVMDYLRRHHLEPDDLLRFGGQDLSDRDVRVRDKVRAVERAWSLLASLNLKFESFMRLRRPAAEEGRRPVQDDGRIVNLVAGVQAR